MLYVRTTIVKNVSVQEVKYLSWQFDSRLALCSAIIAAVVQYYIYYIYILYILYYIYTIYIHWSECKRFKRRVSCDWLTKFDGGHACVWVVCVKTRLLIVFVTQGCSLNCWCSSRSRCYSFLFFLLKKNL